MVVGGTACMNGTETYGTGDGERPGMEEMTPVI
jgi:hypothetical protein